MKTKDTRILIDAGYPLFLNGKPLEEKPSDNSYENLKVLGILPEIRGLYKNDKPGFDGILISHAHLDHYGLLEYVHKDIPVYMSEGTQKIISISNKFIKQAPVIQNIKTFTMYESFDIGDFQIKPFLMDHSAFDAAAFEISHNKKTIIYTGDFRGHGRKHKCLNIFLAKASKNVDALFIEGTLFEREDEIIKSEMDLEEDIVENCREFKGPILFQSSSQNIDRIVTFFRASLRLKRYFAIDVYTANILSELAKIIPSIPSPSKKMPNIRVFFPYYLTKKIFSHIGAEYAKNFSSFRFSKADIETCQNDLIMIVRPSMLKDLKSMGLKNGKFIYSLWQGYRDSDYQKKFEEYLISQGFTCEHLHTSGHATVEDIKKVINKLNPKTILPVHTLSPNRFTETWNNVSLYEDGQEFNI